MSDIDRRLIRLFEFALWAAKLTLNGSLSTDDLIDIELHVYPDGDLAGNFWDTKSTAGMWVELAGLQGRRWPLSWQSKAEPAIANHTQEAETVSLSIAIRNEAAPLQRLLATLLGRPITCRVFEDNEATTTAVKKGYSPSLRHLPRHQRCALGTVHETFFMDDDLTGQGKEEYQKIVAEYGHMLLEHKDTKEHKGDFFTKELPRVQFDAQLRMLGVH